MIFWTGDNSPHNVWSNNENDVIQSTVNITKSLNSSFQNQQVSIFPIQGSFDHWPTNYQDFSYPNSNNPINTYSQGWAGFLDAANKQLYAEFGYYSQTYTVKNN